MIRDEFNQLAARIVVLEREGARLFGIADEEIFRRIYYALIAVAVLVTLPLDGVVR